MTIAAAKVLNALRHSWIERANSCGYKGKKRTDACLDYLTGALAMISAQDDPDFGVEIGFQISNSIFVIAIRGTADYEKLNIK
jgi:hypothetical protein